MVVDGVGFGSILTGGVLPLGEVVGLEGGALHIPWVCALLDWL